MSAVTEAIARAVELDAREAAGTLPTDVAEALAHAVDLSIYGFAHDLRSELHDIREERIEYTPHRERFDRDGCLAGWLEEDIEEEQAEHARAWLAKVDAIMQAETVKEAA